MRAVLSLLRVYSWQALRHHPWRYAAAVLAVTLGVALAFSVHLINGSALSEFSQAVRSVNGQPDLELRATQGGFDESLYRRIALDPAVAVASPVLELNTYAVGPGGERAPIRIVGLDALVAGFVSPSLMPQPTTTPGDAPPNASEADDASDANDADRLDLFAPATAYLNAAAQRWVVPGQRHLRLQHGLSVAPVSWAGRVAAGGPALAVMDLGAAQDLFDRVGQLTRIDVRLAPGIDRTAWVTALRGEGLGPDVAVAEPGDGALRISNLSRAYRVNLTVLALVALFTGAFLVFSVLSLSVAQRVRQFALMGVLGLTAPERLGLVLAESLVLGLAGSLLGVGLGTALAALALGFLGGDLGGGYFSGVAPSLQWDGTAALAYGALGTAAALVGGWWPARTAQQVPLAASLKGLGMVADAGHRTAAQRWVGPGLMAFGAALALAPPVGGIPLAAYGSVACLLVGGIATLPALIGVLFARLPDGVVHRPLPLLAIERARRVRGTAAVAVSGVVAALSLAVALTVMVASFRDSVTQWLDVVLPADLYLRPATGSGSGATADSVYVDAAFVAAVRALPGVAQVGVQRTRSLSLDPALPPVVLIARPLDEPARQLALVSAPLPVPQGQIGIYVSEAMVDLHGARLGDTFSPLSGHFQAPAHVQTTAPAIFFVAGIWRDYARQFGAIAMDQADFVRLTGDQRVNDLALWVTEGSDLPALQDAIRQLVPDAAGLLEFASARDIRALSLRIFDRSFAVTYWLQAVAIAIGLFGVAASFSAQVLARRKEFGLLAHLGLTRRQVLAVVAGEGAAWTGVGALAGVALGLAVAVVLVHVVNPQSFHWTMDLSLPGVRLLALAAAVVAAGTATAWVAGRAAAGREAVMAVKEDW